MKTLEDLKNLFPILVDYVRENDHRIGSCYYEQDEDGWGLCCDYENNYVCYEEDGWYIEISYKCAGTWCEDGDGYWTPRETYLKSASGGVEEITATHYDEETGEETEFDDDDLDELYRRINKELENL